MFRFTMGPALAGLVFSAAISPAFAGSGADFFQGKTVNYIVATGPGGGFDSYGRLVAEYMQKYLPGSTFVVQNMPGAGHMLGASYIAGSKPDGLTIGTFNTGLVYSQLAGVSGTRFDLGKMSWIGKAASDPRAIIVSKDSGINDIKSLMTSGRKVKFGAAGVGSGSYVETLMLAQAVGLPVEIVSGYNGNEDELAMMRGEIQGVVAFRSSYEDFVRDGRGRFIAQIGGSSKDLPQLADLATSEQAKQVIALIASQGTIARLTVGPEGIPEDRLAALRDAYRQAVADPEFVAKANGMGLPVDAMVGDDVGKAIKAALHQSPETVALIRQSLSTGQ
jgi:tripartite-type tricarboxylate transporter receptor subunit TctC